MQKYELTVVLDGKVTSGKKKKIAETIEKIVTITKGKLGKLEDWGVKDLAFMIGKFSTGLYLHYPLELEELSVSGISAKLNQEGDILRYLLIKVENTPSRKATEKLNG